MLRIGLFLATNIAIMVVISLVFSLLGFEGILAENGVDINLQALLVMSVIIGFSGSFISLFISKWMAKRSMGVRIIEQPSNSTESFLIDTVRTQAERAGIGMPEVGIFDSPEPNAFATGASRNNALIAVSTGLLQRMKQAEIKAVLGHEVSHVANGDMITMALIQGVVNTFVVFLARLVGFFVDRVILKNKRGLGIGYFVTSIIAQIFLSVLASIIVMWFSRRREFHADAGGASLAGRQNMINALTALGGPAQAAAAELPDQMAGFGISGKFGSLFASHPPLEVRIAALKAQQ
ncbi:MAG: heat shock protein HtpX [Gammaproteobacteria bacterium]|jgi:heat shock protein HtpX|tara:strand:- start:2016 stop:2894 length:879 start_codon:yes stop_codon:yes gene_type:complete